MGMEDWGVSKKNQRESEEWQVRKGKVSHKAALEIVFPGGVPNGLLDGKESHDFPEVGLEGEDIFITGESEGGGEHQI